jgi:hypothetical protein
MLKRRFATAADAAGRSVIALGFLAALLLPTFGPLAAVGTAAEPVDPAARLQVIIKSVYVLSDRDVASSGEMDLFTQMGSCNEGIPPPCFNEGGWGEWRGLDVIDGEHIWWEEHEFGADSGETVTLNRLLPPGNTGWPVFAGQHYVVAFGLWELDVQSAAVAPFSPDYLGHVVHSLDAEEQGLGIGTHTASSSKQCSTGIIVRTVGPCFDITYEIRRTPLPDLKPTDMEISRLSDGRDSVCVRLENVGQEENAVPFDMNIHLDGTIVGTKRLLGPRVGQPSYVECILTNLPGGLHKVSVFVDEGREVPEMDELNNELETMCCVHVPGGLPVLQPTGGPRPDLVVTSLKAAREANGSGQCEGGKTNYLFAQVKNVGPVAAGPFAVRAEVSGSLIKEKGSVPGLAAGAMVEVTIPTDDLKDGSQPVKVIADGDNQVGEQDEGNNAYQITANCI